MNWKPASLAVLLVLCGSAVGRQPAADRYAGNCTDAGCHDTFAKRKVVHSPVEQGACDACHEKTGEGKHTFKLTADEDKLCGGCHEAPAGKVIHAPAAQGQCATCHDPHAADAKGLLTADSQSALCGTCHDDYSKKHKYLHGPVAAGDCTACHQAHASEHKALLEQEGNAVCEQCHTDVTERVRKMKYPHAPAADDCTGCHNPHGGDNPMNLTAAPPSLCLDCHDDVAQVVKDAKVGHEAVTTGRACAACHEPHGSNVEHILAKEPMDLCLSCHNEEVKAGDRQIASIGAILKDSPEHHGPIRQKDCGACHKDVHGGPRFRLLSGEFPESFYAPFEEATYALCFQCHEAALARDQRTEDATGFRNGDQNLHYLHVNKSPKGRTCRACHAVHASRQPKQIADSVRFGKWEYPIKYEQSANGGSCLPGCHKLYRYDRTSRVQNVQP